MKTCSNCGTTMSDDKEYCTFCGTPLQPIVPKAPANPHNDYPAANIVTEVVSDDETEYPEEVNAVETEQMPLTTPPRPNQQRGQYKRRGPAPNRPKDEYTDRVHRPAHPLNDRDVSIPYEMPPTLNEKPKSNMLTIVLIACIVVLIIVCAIGIYIYIDSKKQAEQDAEEQYDGNHEQSMGELTVAEGSNAYVVSSLNLRAEPSLSSKRSVKAVLPYGTEVQIQKLDGPWSYVKVVGPMYRGLEGWVATHYVVSPSDFTLLKSFIANDDTYKSIKESYYLYALLQYFNERNFIGRLSNAQLADIGLSDFKRSDENQWEIKVTNLPPYPSEILTQKLINPACPYKDLAVIITNLSTGQRRLLYFTFDNDEHATLYRDIALPALGKLTAIELKPNGDLQVHLAD